MSSEFDASRVYMEPVAADIIEWQKGIVEQLALRPSALENAKLHTENELQRIINVTNRLAWGEVPDDLREPTAEEAAALLERLSEEDREKLIKEAYAGAEQRSIVAMIREAHERCVAEMHAEQEALAHQQAKARERAEFETFDAAGKEQRFQAWRASRQQAAS
ncbi:MAG: hypothetical protein ACFCUR_10935 [Rhodomicrobiaceae bacterium]